MKKAILILCICFMVTGCVSVKKTSKSGSYKLDFSRVGYKPVKAWVSKYGDLTLLQAYLDESYKLDGAFKNGPISLKVKNVTKYRIWHLDGLDVLLLIGESSLGTPMHEIVTVSERKVIKTALESSMKVVYRPGENLEGIIRGELPEKFEDSRYYVFMDSEHFGPKPSSKLTGKIREFYQDLYLNTSLEDPAPFKDEDQSVEVQPAAEPSKKTLSDARVKVQENPNPEFEVFQPVSGSVVPSDKVSADPLKKVEVKID